MVGIQVALFPLLTFRAGKGNKSIDCGPEKSVLVDVHDPAGSTGAFAKVKRGLSDLDDSVGMEVWAESAA